MLKGNKFEGAKVRFLKQITKDTTAPVSLSRIIKKIKLFEVF